MTESTGAPPSKTEKSTKEDDKAVDATTDDSTNAKADETAAATTNVTEIEASKSDDKKEDVKDEEVVSNKKKTTSSPADNAAPVAKKAKIAMPPAVSALQLNVDKYTLDETPAADANRDASTKIVTSSLMIFGLHPLVKEDPFKKLCEDYGEITSFGVRSAFASRYCHLAYDAIPSAQAAYQALNTAKLFQKPLLVQPAPKAPADT